MSDNALLYLGVLLFVSLLVVPGMYRFYYALRQSDPAVVSTLQTSYIELSKRQDELEELRRRDREELLRVNTELARISLLLERWMAHAEVLSDILRRKGETVPLSPEDIDKYERSRRVTADNPARLKHRIIEYFSYEEIGSLAFDLGLQDHLRGENIVERAESLVGIAYRSNKMGELIELCREQRPKGGFN